MQRSLTPASGHAGRVAQGALAVTLLAALALVVWRSEVAWWHAALLWLAPDLPLLAGFGHGVERGRLHPRSVPAYNASHRWWGPVALLALTAAVGFPTLPLVAALAWSSHIAVDRAVGYGLRSADGHRRG